MIWHEPIFYAAVFLGLVGFAGVVLGIVMGYREVVKIRDSAKP